MNTLQFKDFLEAKRIFTVGEIEAFLGRRIPRSNLDNLLAYHLKRGHIIRIHAGLYYVVPPRIKASVCLAEPYLVASRLCKDAVLGYSTAFSFFGKAHTVRNEYVVLTKGSAKKSGFWFQGHSYKITKFPQKLIDAGQERFCVKTYDVEGEKVDVTTIERAFVDVLDRPALFSDDWEEICRCIENIEYLVLDDVWEYLLLLGTKHTVAKVGYFLEENKDHWFVPDEFIQKLAGLVPRNPVYLDRSIKEEHQFLKRWNLYVPISIYKKTWEEPYEDI